MEEGKEGERSHRKTRNHIKKIHKQIRQGTFIKKAKHMALELNHQFMQNKLVSIFLASRGCNKASSKCEKGRRHPQRVPVQEKTPERKRVGKIEKASQCIFL